MKMKQLILALFLLSPCLALSQENTEAENFSTNVINKVKEYNEESRKLKEAFKSAKENNQADTVSLKEQRRKVIEKCFQVPQYYIKANPASPYSCRALAMLGEGGKGSPVTVSDLERLFNSLAPELKDSDAGKTYAEQLASWKERDKKK